MLEILFDAGMYELDMFQLTVLLGLSAAFGLLVLLLPNDWRTAQRWLALVGACLTLIVALCTQIDYYNLLDSRSDRTTRSLHHPATSLESRAAYLEQVIFTGDGKFLSDDLIVRRAWIERFDIDYSVGVDGISLALILLVCVGTLIAVVATWKVEHGTRLMLFLLLVLQSSVIGALLAQNLVLLYVCNQVAVVAVGVLMARFCESGPKRGMLPFVASQLIASVCLLLGLVSIHSVNVRDVVNQAIVEQRTTTLMKQGGYATREEAKAAVHVTSFDIHALGKANRVGALLLTGQRDRIAVQKQPNLPDGAVPLLAAGVDRDAAIGRLMAESPLGEPWIVFVLFAIGFSIQLGVVPFHSWLVRAHGAVPLPVSLAITGVFVVLGGYGWMRFVLPLAPSAAAQASVIVGWLGVAAMVCGAIAAVLQKDVNKFLACYGVGQLGLVLVGLTAWGGSTGADAWTYAATGALYQILAQGLSVCGLLFAIDLVRDRTQHRGIASLDGLIFRCPPLVAFLTVFGLASAGMPGLCGFIGQFLVVGAVWPCCMGRAVGTVLALASLAGVLAFTLLRMYRKPVDQPLPKFALTSREVFALTSLSLLCVALGVAPGLTMLSWAEPAVQAWVIPLSQLRP